MKKIIKRICLGLLIFIVVVVSAVCVFLFSGGEKPTVFIPTVTDANGTAYGVVQGDKGESLIVVTDQNGDRYAAITNADGTPGETVAQINDQVEIDQLPQNNSGPVIDDTVSGNNFSGQVITEPGTGSVVQGQTQGTTGNSQQVTTSPQGATNSQQGTTVSQSGGSDKNQNTTNSSSGQNNGTGKYKLEKYQQMFLSNQYLMEFTTDDPAFGSEPVTFATKNGNFIMSASMDNFKCKILYIKSKKTTYVLMDNFKKYSKMPADTLDMSEDMNMMSGLGETDISSKDVKVSEVTINGQKLTCESYKSKDGSVSKYYFSGDTLVRIDTIDKDGQSFSTYINRITSDVPDSTFEIPKDYGYLNLSWLGKLSGMGDDSSTTTKKSSGN